MSTPNFYSKAGTVYALDFSDDAGEYDQFIADTVIEDVTTAVIEQLRAFKLDVTEADDSDGERSYPGEYFGRVELNKHRSDIWIEAGLIIRSGYYADANLDFEIKVFTAYDGEYSDIEYLDAQIVADAIDAGINTKKVASVLDRLESQAQKLESMIRVAYANNTTSLRRVAVFSNGEAVYERIGGKNQ